MSDNAFDRAVKAATTAIKEHFDLSEEAEILITETAHIEKGNTRRNYHKFEARDMMHKPFARVRTGVCEIIAVDSKPVAAHTFEHVYSGLCKEEVPA